MVSTEGVAWFLMGEGSISVVICRLSSTHKYYANLLGFRAQPTVALTNTELEYLTPIKKWCDENNIKSYITKTKRKSSFKSIYILYINSYNSVEKFLKLVYPHLLGSTKKVADLLLDYVKKFRRKRGNPLPINEEINRFLEQVKYHDKIMSLNNRKRRSKYSYEYFLDYFDKNRGRLKNLRRHKRFKCNKCGYSWVSLIPNPTKCPSCGAHRFWAKRVTCMICGYEWFPRVETPRMCPNCRSSAYATPY